MRSVRRRIMDRHDYILSCFLVVFVVFIATCVGVVNYDRNAIERTVVEATVVNLYFQEAYAATDQNGNTTFHSPKWCVLWAYENLRYTYKFDSEGYGGWKKGDKAEFWLVTTPISKIRYLEVKKQ